MTTDVSYNMDQTDLIQDATHPVEENLEEVALEERDVQVTLLERLWVSPPVPLLADPAIVPELQRTVQLVLINILLLKIQKIMASSS